MMNSVLRTIICGMMIVISSSMIKSPVLASGGDKDSAWLERSSRAHERAVNKVVSHRKYKHTKAYKRGEPKYTGYRKSHKREAHDTRSGIGKRADSEDSFRSERRGSLKDNPRDYGSHKKFSRSHNRSYHSRKYSRTGYLKRHAKRSGHNRFSLKDERKVYKKASSSRKNPRNRDYAGKAAIVGRSQYSSLIAKHANAMGVPVKLAHAVVSIESSFRASTRGAAGEVGLMQIKPSTARAMGFRGTSSALFDPDTNIKYGMKYLAGAYKMSGGSLCGTILRYNAGHYAKRMNPISARYCSKAKRIIGSQDL